MSKLARVKSAVKNNPTTTFVSTGLTLAGAVALFSQLFGLDWDAATQTQVTNDIIMATALLTPVFRFAVYLWQRYVTKEI